MKNTNKRAALLFARCFGATLAVAQDATIRRRIRPTAGKELNAYGDARPASTPPRSFGTRLTISLGALTAIKKVSSHLLQEFLCYWKARPRANDGIDAAAWTTGGRTAIPLGNPVPDFRRWEGFPAVETPAEVAGYNLITVG